MTESRSIEADEQTEAQSHLLTYWTSLIDEDALPRRGSFDPGAVLRYLGGITILELTEAGQLVCRVESGSIKAQLSAQDLLASRRLGLDMLLQNQSPVRGHRSTSCGIHHWLRLPLLSDGGDRLVILCYDEFVIDRNSSGKYSGPNETLSSHCDALAA